MSNSEILEMICCRWNCGVGDTRFDSVHLLRCLCTNIRALNSAAVKVEGDETGVLSQIIESFFPWQ